MLNGQVIIVLRKGQEMRLEVERVEIRYVDVIFSVSLFLSMLRNARHFYQRELHIRVPDSTASVVALAVGLISV